MLSYQKLCQRRGSFKSLTGLTVVEFEALYAQFAPAWAVAEEQRLSRSNRQREIGGGRDYSLNTPTQLVMVLMWLRLYLTTDALGCLFDIDKSTVSRNNRRVLTVLRTLSQDALGWPEPPAKGQGKNLGEALHDYPDLMAVLDATEQAVQRPKEKVREKRYYSGKSRRHTVKNALVVNEQGLIRAVSESTPGSMHDLTHVRQAGILDDIPEEVGVVADAGFDGLYKDLPQHSVATAHKAYRNHPLTPEQRAVNRELSSLRVIVENVFCHLKHFRILSERFRHQVERWHSDVFFVVAALINRRIAQRLMQTT